MVAYGRLRFNSFDYEQDAIGNLLEIILIECGALRSHTKYLSVSNVSLVTRLDNVMAFLHFRR